MSEFNVDTAGREELEAAAADLGIKVQANTKDETLRMNIKEKLGDAQPPGTTNANSDTAPSESKKARRFEIIVSTHDQDKQPVQVGVNGRSYVIERGKKVIVPESVVEVLNNAVQHQYDPKTMEETRVMAYPFQTVREVE